MEIYIKIPLEVIGMAKLSNNFKETMKEVAVTVIINAAGNILKTVGEALISNKKFEKITQEGSALIDNGKI